MHSKVNITLNTQALYTESDKNLVTRNFILFINALNKRVVSQKKDEEFQGKLRLLFDITLQLLLTVIYLCVCGS